MNELSTTFETVKGKEVHLFLNVNHDSYIDPVLFYSLIFTVLFSAFIFWVRSLEKRVNTLISNYNLVREKILQIEEKSKKGCGGCKKSISQEPKELIETHEESECCENDCSTCLLADTCENKK
jgi:hypothetical protein